MFNNQVFNNLCFINTVFTVSIHKERMRQIMMFAELELHSLYIQAHAFNHIFTQGNHITLIANNLLSTVEHFPRTDT